MQKKICVAHINDMHEEQSLAEHCRAVAAYTAETMEKMHLHHLGYLTGLLHDLGKATGAFDDYLRRSHNGEPVSRGAINHTFAAVIYIWERYHKTGDGFQWLTAELIAYAAGAHHGLFDCVNMETVGQKDFLYRLQKDKQEIYYAEAKQNYFSQVATEDEIEQLFLAAVEELQQIKNIAQQPFDRGLLVRMLLSALIDADRRDTAEFMSGQRQKKYLGEKEFWQRNLQFCEAQIAKFPQDSAIQQARKYISDTCREKAEAFGNGIYQLKAYAGSGKTISSLRYALAHGQKFNKDRIIFIIPLLSVLEQNAEELKKYLLDKEAVAEHHSNAVQQILLQNETKDNRSENILKKYELVVESWNAPIMISTLVQFLNILFTDKTTAIRRMQALCNSVIVIDEIQSLPWKTTSMFIKALNFLAKYCNCTVVLSSATQPCFENLKIPLELAEDYDMVPANATLYQAFERTRIVDLTRPQGYTPQEIADFADELLQEVSSVLIVCNTKKTAQEIYQQAQTQGYKVLYLSTGMCMAHRVDTIAYINKILKQNQTSEQKEKLLCISTQLVEAGINFSFERAIRLTAGLDNIIQVAGRCNRSFDYGYICPVYIMNVQNEKLGQLKEIEQRKNATEKLLNAFAQYPENYDNSLASEKSIAMYYRCLMPCLEQRDILKYVAKFSGERYTLFDLLNKPEDGTLGLFMTQPFKSVGEMFTVFDQRTIDVIVPYGTEGDTLVTDLLCKRTSYDLQYMRECLRKASFYTISLFEHQVRALGKRLRQYEWEDGAFYVLHESCYDGRLGGIGFQMDGELEVMIY